MQYPLRDHHCHTRYCDGADTVEAMAEAAAARGLAALTFTGHGYTPHDLSCATAPPDMARYAADVRAAAARWAGRLEIHLGMEDDLHGQRPPFAADYTIGSVHDVFAAGTHFAVDASAALLEKGVRTCFGGDWLAMTAAYYRTVASVRDVTGCDVVGHFDLVTKFNEGGRRFSEEDPRYLGPALEAASYLAGQGCLFEINTGAMSRGYRTAPYPSRPLLEAIRRQGGRVVLSSDAHAAAAVGAHFAEAAALAWSCGFREVWCYTGAGWQPFPLTEA